jgi:hypothetical protein
VGSAERTLEDIARENGTSAMGLYMMIKKYEPKEEETAASYTPELVEERFAGSGIGRMTLEWLLEDMGVDPGVARERLAASGIEITAGETLKAAAERSEVEPIEILKVILVEGYEPAHSD